MPSRLGILPCQLYAKIGRPSYRDLHNISKRMGMEPPVATISDLIGRNSMNRISKPAWRPVEWFVLACGVPEAHLMN